jgi:precorrin-6Y C5,15-methyltransferase (decarboxylating)
VPRLVGVLKRELQPVVIAGIGDGGPDGLTREAGEALTSADLVCGGARHLAMLRGWPGRSGAQFTITKDLTALADTVEAARQVGKQVVVLASGDPLFFGIGAFLIARLGGENVRVVPHVSSVQLAFARLGVAWQDAVVLSAHGRPLEPTLGRAMAGATLAFLTDDVNTPAAIARALLDGGMEDADAAVCEHLGGDAERVVRAPLSQIAGQRFARLNVLVVLRDPAAVRWGRPLLGRPDDAYAHARGQITKAEVRAVSIARLGMDRAGVLWDVGAGCGAVAIEAASLRPDALVCAVERDPQQLALLRGNVRRSTAGNVRVVAGEAPAALADLPDPDAVFIGGTGGRLAGVLDSVGGRLRPGGRLVLNLVTLDHLAEARACLDALGWPHDVTQLSVARSTPIAGSVRLAALNPVFVMGAERPA